MRAGYFCTSSSYLQSLQSLKQCLVMAETVMSSGCEVCGHCGKSLGERFLKVTGGSTTVKTGGYITRASSRRKQQFCSEPSMGMQSHASSDNELHSEEDGMARTEWN